MPYVGRDLQRGNYLKLDDISSSFDGSTTTFNLQSGGSAFYPGSAFSIFVVLSGLAQEPESAYTINKNTITFASAPSSVDDCFITALGVALGIGVPGHGTVNGSQLAKPFNYDGGLLYLDSTNDRIGIGNTVPSYTLDVNGTANFSGNVTVGGTLTYQDVASIDAVGISTFQDDVNFNGTGAGISSAFWDKSANEFKFKDNVKLSFGDSQDLSIYHDGSHSWLKNTTGYLRFATDASGFTFSNADNTQAIAQFVKGGSVDLYHNNNLRFATTGTGVNITDNLNVAGIVTATTDIHVAGNIAHLGDTDTRVGFETNRINFEAHNSNRMYISQYGIFVQSGLGLGFLASTGPSPNIKSGGTNNQDLLFTTGTSNPTRLQITSAGKLQVKGTRGGNLQPEDDDTLQLYTASTNNSTNRGSGITFYNHDNSGYEMGGTIQVAKENGNADDEAAYMRFSTRPAGSAAQERLRIDSDGRILVNGITAVDDWMLQIAGAGGTARVPAILFKNGTASTNETIGGWTAYNTSNQVAYVLAAEESANDDAYIKFATRKTGGSITERLRIHADGEVDVKGGAAGQNALLVTGNYSASNNVDIQTWQRSGGAVQAKMIYKDADTSMHFGTDTAHKLCLMTSGTERLRIKSGGEIRIGADTTTASTAGDDLVIEGSSDRGLSIISGSSSSSNIYFGHSSDADEGRIAYQHNDNALDFQTNGGATDLRIDSAGRVLIGTMTEGHASAHNLTLETSGTTGITLRSATNGEGNIFFSDGTSGDSEYRGIIRYEHANDAMTFKTSAVGQERVRIHSNGRIGIGTDTAPRDMVHLHNPNANASSYVQFTNANTGGTGINDGTLIGISQNNSNTDGTGSGFTILQKEDAEITLGTNGLERLRIASNGNVSIGGGDPTPSASGYNKACLHIMQSNSGTSVGSQLKFSVANSGHNASDGGFISFWGDKNFYYNNMENSGLHRFYVKDGSGTNKEMLQVGYDAVYVSGHFDAVTKSFLIDHPTKENHKLRYACLEGPENSVYVRGRSSDSVIELPDYWVGLVHEDSITVNVTPIGNKNVWVESINNNSVTIGSDDSTEYFYTVFAERKDVEKLEVEVEN